MLAVDQTYAEDIFLLESKRPSTSLSKVLPNANDLQRHASRKWEAIIGKIDFKTVEQHALSRSRTPLESRLFIKLLYRRLPVNHYSSNENEGARHCNRCTYHDETISHAIYQCSQSCAFWLNVGIVLEKLLEREIPQITLSDVVYVFPLLRKTLNKEQLHVLNVVHSVALWTIWSSRTNSYQCTGMGVDINLESFYLRLRARIELEYTASLHNDFETNSDAFSSPPMSPVSSISEKSSSDSLRSLELDMRDGGIQDIDSDGRRSMEFSPIESNHVKLFDDAGAEEKSFLNRWCTSYFVSLNNNGKVSFIL